MDRASSAVPDMLQVRKSLGRRQEKSPLQRRGGLNASRICMRRVQKESQVTCPLCGGCVIRDKDFCDYGPTSAQKCLNCGWRSFERPRVEKSTDLRKIRGRLDEVLSGWKATDYPLEEEKIGNLGNDEEEPRYRKESGKIPKKEGAPVGRKTQSDLAAVRRERLKLLSDRFHTHYWMAKKYPDLSASTLGNVLSGKYTMGYRQARKIEQAVGLPPGWMDENASEVLPDSFGHSGQEDNSEKPIKRGNKGRRPHRHPEGSGENARPAREESKISDSPPLIHEHTTTIPPRSLKDLLTSLTTNPRVLQVDLVIVTLAEVP